MRETKGGFTKHSRPTNDNFAEVLSRAPPVTELPWMRVELQGETGQWFVFSMAVFEGWVVATAPVAKRAFGQRARAVWKLYASRGAKLMRMDPVDN